MFKRYLASAVLALLAVGLLGWAIVSLGDDDDGSSAASAPEILSTEQLSEAVADVDHPVYWLGEREGEELEWTATADGGLYIRYLPEGTEAGDARADFLTVGTYPSPDGGVAELRRAARGSEGAELAQTEDGAVLLIDPASPNSAYLAYLDSDTQIEVFSPEPGEALRLAAEGSVETVP